MLFFWKKKKRIVPFAGRSIYYHWTAAHLYMYRDTHHCYKRESHSHKFCFFFPFFSLIVLSLTLSLRQVGRQRSGSKKKAEEGQQQQQQLFFFFFFLFPWAEKRRKYLEGRNDVPLIVWAEINLRKRNRTTTKKRKSSRKSFCKTFGNVEKIVGGSNRMKIKS